jgi:hypothetical protein
VGEQTGGAQAFEHGIEALGALRMLGAPNQVLAVDGVGE